MERSTHFEVGLSVEIGRGDVALALGVGRGEQHQVAREALVALHAHQVAHADVLRSDWLSRDPTLVISFYLAKPTIKIGS